MIQLITNNKKRSQTINVRISQIYFLNILSVKKERGHIKFLRIPRKNASIKYRF